MNSSNARKAETLGMPGGTAANRLRKMLSPSGTTKMGGNAGSIPVCRKRASRQSSNGKTPS